MIKLKVQRVPFSADADSRLRMLKARTGVTPNLICRLGFCLSLEEPGSPRTAPDFKAEREINRYTLLGEYDAVLVALLQARLIADKEPLTSCDEAFVAHMNRGVELLATRLRSLSDLGPMLSAVLSK